MTKRLVALTEGKQARSRPHFLQGANSRNDLLFLNGRDLRTLPLIERRTDLRKLLRLSFLFCYCGHRVLATVFLHVFEELGVRFEALLVGLGRDFTKLGKFIAWDDASGGLFHRTDTS